MSYKHRNTYIQPSDPRENTYRKTSGRHRCQQPHQSQTQIQGQLQRPKEASKQMLYGTFANVLGTLEEYEKKELRAKGTRLPHGIRRSNLDIRDQTHKTIEDLSSNVETQLLLFETQNNVCPPEVKSALQEELRRKAIGWSSVRAEMGLPENQHTDRYIAQLYEILSTGRTDHKIPSRHDLNENVMREGFQAIIYGSHDREMLDQSFRRNPNKMATGPDTRHSEMFDEGAGRISRTRGTISLNHSLQHDVRKFQEYGRTDFK